MIRFHWQNLNDDKRGNPKAWPYHGRAWLTLGPVTLRWCWDFWSHFCGLSVDTGDCENGVTLFAAFPPVALWFGIETRPFTRGPEREVSLRIHDSAIWWRVWTDPNSWSSRTPKWRDGCFRPVDALLGRAKYEERVLSTHQVTVPMPEGGYPATVVLREDTWKRPRWPWAKRLRRACVDLPKGIPHQGKGENSWDCGEDALMGMSCQARTVEEAVAAVVQSALRSRRRYDGNVMAKYPAPLPTAGGGR